MSRSIALSVLTIAACLATRAHAGQPYIPSLPVSGDVVLSTANDAIMRGMKQLATDDMNARLDKMPCYKAWESMDDFDSPIASLMMIISPDDAGQVKLNFLKDAQNRLKAKSTPKLSAEEAMNAFAGEIAFNLQKISATKKNKLVLVLKGAEASGEANQQLVDDVFGKLVENPALTSDFGIISIPKQTAEQVVSQLSGGPDHWTAPAGSTAGGVVQANYHPDDIYTIEGTLRQWTGEDGDVFHSEFAARIYHPRTQTMVTGKEIRQDSDFYFHPTRGWLSTVQDDALAKAFVGEPDLAPAFAQVAPMAGALVRNRLQTLNQSRSVQNSQSSLLAIDGATRILAKSEYENRLNAMPADLAWKDIEQPGSHVNTLLTMLSPAGVADAKKKYARRAGSAFRVQATPTLSSVDLITAFSATLSNKLKADQATLGHKPVLVLGEVTTDDAQAQKLIYDAYEAVVKNVNVQQNCTVIGLSPLKARTLIDDLSGDLSRWTVPDGSNVSEVNLKTFDPADMRIVQGEFIEAKGQDNHWFRSSLVATVVPAEKAKDPAAAMKVSADNVYFYHPTLNWISSNQEVALQTKYVPTRDDPNLPQALQPSALAAAASKAVQAAPTAPTHIKVNKPTIPTRLPIKLPFFH